MQIQHAIQELQEYSKIVDELNLKGISPEQAEIFREFYERNVYLNEIGNDVGKANLDFLERMKKRNTDG